MRIGLVGLGKMGYNLALNLQDNGHEVVAYNRSRDRIDEIKKHGVFGAYSLDELVRGLSGRRVIWLMVPAGSAVDELIGALAPILNKGDIIIDGGNSNYKDTLRRYETLKEKGIGFADVGTSGGVWGLERGYCLMIGGETAQVGHLPHLLSSVLQEIPCTSASAHSIAGNASQ